MAAHGIPTPEDEIAQPVDGSEETLLGRPLDADSVEEAESEDEHKTARHSRASKK